MYQHDFVLIDRSGSMSGLWYEALSSVNAYVKKLADQDINTGVTVAFFDSDESGIKFEIVRDRITPKTFRPLSNEDGIPRGLTPLSDATGKIVALAEAGNYDKVSIVIMTDGHENSSKVFTVSDAKAALDRCRKKDWAVTFLGANFDNATQASLYGSLPQYQVHSSTANLRGTLEALGGKRAFYASAKVGDAAETTMVWSDLEKAEASSDKE